MAKDIQILQVTFLPYIFLEEELQIDEFILWPFDKKKDKYIKDIKLKKQLEFIFSFYINREKKPLKNITIVSLKNNNFKPFNKFQFERLKALVSILAFSTIIRNSSIIFFSNENFQITQRNFSVGEDKVAIQAGSYAKFTTDGYDIKNTYFTLPDYIDRSYPINFNTDLFNALINLLKNWKQKKESARIIRSLEWFNYAYTNVDNFNYSNRILMLSIAFETLLNITSNKVNKNFILKIEELTSPFYGPKIRKILHCRNVGYTKEGKWARKFYNLRSRIVHGNKLSKDKIIYKKGKKHEEHFIIGSMFFEECVKKILHKYNFYDYSDRDRILWNRIDYYI